MPSRSTEGLRGLIVSEQLTTVLHVALPYITLLTYEITPGQRMNTIGRHKDVYYIFKEAIKINKFILTECHFKYKYESHVNLRKYVY